MTTTVDHPSESSEFALSDEQANFFETFGFLRIKGLFADDIERIDAGFEEVFANEAHERMETFETLHKNDRRIIIPSFIDRSPDLAWLKTDPRLLNIVRRVIGDEFEYAESDGNLFDCESSWHADMYGAPLWQHHVKFSFYLEPLRRDSGAIRVIPGTNFNKSDYARTLRRDFEDTTRIGEIYGIADEDVPSWAVETDPGDLTMWSYRTIHASFGGGIRRRLFSVSFREPAPAETA